MPRKMSKAAKVAAYDALRLRVDLLEVALTDQIDKPVRRPHLGFPITVTIDPPDRMSGATYKATLYRPRGANPYVIVQWPKEVSHFEVYYWDDWQPHSMDWNALRLKEKLKRAWDLHLQVAKVLSDHHHYPEVPPKPAQ